VFGALGARLGFAADETARGFVFVQLRGWIAAAVRLNIVGPMAGQAVQAAMAGRAAAAASLGLAIPPEDAAQTAPMLDLWQGGQDRLYSRLFQT
jgi:urease accessory protein